MNLLSNFRKLAAPAAVICVLVGSVWATPATGDVTFTVNIDSFEYPYASKKDNQIALALMLAHVSVVGHYYKRGSYLRGSSCGRLSTCHFLPHFEEGEKDHPVMVDVAAVAVGDGKGGFKLDFKLPEKNSGAELKLVTLVVPLDDLWRQPSVRKAIEKASTSLPDYEKYHDAQEKGSTVAVDLIAPEAVNRPGPFLYYCPAIQNPMSWNHSGVLHMQLLVQTASGKLWSEGGDLLRRVASDGQCMHPSAKPGEDEFYRSEHE
jgi:hypothetical protein